MMMGLLAFESHQGLWNSGYYSQFFGIGGVMITVAILMLSTGYFGGIGAPFAPYFWPYLGQVPKKRERKRPVRVYMDGCFDLMHYGHANALRQAKLLGDQLVVGVVSDEEIVANKGPPVLSMEERLTLVSGLKWVDEVIPNAPYEITEEFMNTLFNKYSIDYIIHGDDPCLLPDGTDAYALAKKVGRYKQIKRTEGVSSTDIVGRILLTFKQKDADTDFSVAVDEKAGVKPKDEVKSHLSHFLPTSRRIMQFSNGQAPSPGARVVYIDGAFDLFHAGHVEILRSARQLGDFLLVGIHDDQSIRDRRGYRPIMHLHERTLSVLACRYVDEVIIGAPWEVSKDMITTFNISLVVHGTVTEGNSAVSFHMIVENVHIILGSRGEGSRGEGCYHVEDNEANESPRRKKMKMTCHAESSTNSGKLDSSIGEHFSKLMEDKETALELFKGPLSTKNCSVKARRYAFKGKELRCVLNLLRLNWEHHQIFMDLEDSEAKDYALEAIYGFVPPPLPQPPTQ